MDDIEYEDFKQLLLSNYFQFRNNLPCKLDSGAKMIEENKTTEEIQSELEPMCHLEKDDIISYMTSHDYGIKTMPDGSVKWAIWRDASTLL